MKAFAAACAAIVLIALGAGYALDQIDYTTADRTTRDATVRLD